MQQEQSSNIIYLVGEDNILDAINSQKTFSPFAEAVLDFFDDLSKELRLDDTAQQYSDIQTFAYWCRKNNVLKMKMGYSNISERLGRGVVFHIAPSNIPMMFMFSLAVALIAGNPSVVRICSKDFPQTKIVCDIIKKVMERHIWTKNYIVILRYGHEEEITKRMSDICSIRIIWGGNHSVEQIRKVELPPYAIDIPFYDRISFAIINADKYLECKEYKKLAERFYNDTYLMDQNACTSPQFVVWLGENVKKAREIFWDRLLEVVRDRYVFSSIQAVDKIVEASRYAIESYEAKMKWGDSRLCRVEVTELNDAIGRYRCPGGYFYEYIAKDIEEIVSVCVRECQTISYYGVERDEILKIVCDNGCLGVDRIVPIGNTMDFGLKWDGYDFVYILTRVIG